MKILFVLFFILLQHSCTPVISRDRNPSSGRKLIVLSIDGFPGYYLKESSAVLQIMPNLRRLLGRSVHSNQVSTVYPSLTFPAHTSMITGVDPAKHGIFYNNPPDPFKKLEGDWYFFREDIKTLTLYDYMKRAGKKTASLYWPVTVGADIDWNIPQYWKNKTKYDEKYLSAFSTPGLYSELHRKTGSSVGEFTGDEEKVMSAIAVWQHYRPDFMTVYTTDLDTAHHVSGVSSEAAMQKISNIDRLLGKLISAVKLYERSDVGLLVTSDHGFKEVNAVCYPNKVLMDSGAADTETGKWSYLFKSLGGTAVLLKNPDRKSRKNFSLNMDDLRKKIESGCENVILADSGDRFKAAKKKLSSEIEAFLYTEKNTAFSESLGAKELFKPTGTYYNHGFLPEDSDLKTIGIFYPANEEYRMNTVKDVFVNSCRWMNVPCR